MNDCGDEHQGKANCTMQVLKAENIETVVVIIFTMKNVPAGEELLFHYSANDKNAAGTWPHNKVGDDEAI